MLGSSVLSSNDDATMEFIMENKIVSTSDFHDTKCETSRKLDLAEVQDVDVSNGQIYNITTGAIIVSLLLEC